MIEIDLFINQLMATYAIFVAVGGEKSKNITFRKNFEFEKDEKVMAKSLNQ